MVGEGLISKEEAVARIDPAQLDQLLHPMIDPAADVEVVAKGLNASPGAASGAIVFDADTAEERGQGGGERDPRPLGDDAGRLPRDGAGGGDPDRARRADVARRRRRARDGHAVRHRLRGAPRRRPREDGAAARPRAEGGRHDHDRRRHRRGDRRRRAARAAADQRRLLRDPRLGGRDPAAEGAHERRHARGLGQGPRVRGGGDRSLPDRAHVRDRRPARPDAGDDPGRRRGRPPLRARAPAPDPAGRLRGDLRGDGGAAGDDPPPRLAAARVPALARGGAGRAHARADPRAARVEPHARLPRLPARPLLSRDLRDAGARDRAGGDRRAGAGRGGAARRDHASARGLRRGAAPAARADRPRRRRGGRARLPRRDDDRAAAGMYPRRRDRRARGLLLLRHERPDPDRARDLTRRRRPLPRPLPGDGRARARPVRVDRPGRRRRPDGDRGRARAADRDDIKLGICGEHGGEPKSVAFCHRLGLDYVSCSPYRVPLARLAAAQAALAEQGTVAVAIGG